MEVRGSVEDYQRMIAARILGKSDRVALDGYIFERIPQESPHSSKTSIFGNEFVMISVGKAGVRQQLPLMISPNSEPESDIAVVRIDQNRYRDRPSSPQDVYFLIEVANSTIKFDRRQKAQLYAQVHIPEHWVVDFKSCQVWIMLNSHGNKYQSQTVLGIQDLVSPIPFPDIVIQLSEFLG